MKRSEFSLEITTMIIESLAPKKLLRYLCLNLPRVTNDGRLYGTVHQTNENVEFLHNFDWC